MKRGNGAPVTAVSVEAPKPMVDHHALRNRALAAYQAARGRSNTAEAGEAWQVLDARYLQLQQALKDSWAVSATANPNSAADQAARAGEERALLEAIDYFEAYQPPKAPKPMGVFPQVAAYHSANSGEHFLETRARLERERAVPGEAA